MIKAVDSNTLEEVSSDLGLYIHSSRKAQLQNPSNIYSASEVESDATAEPDIHNEVMQNCELFLDPSKTERKAIERRTRQVS
jgi:hypothetical protein